LTRLIVIVLLGVLSLMSFGGCTEEPTGSVTVFCGSASKPPMEEAARAFREKTGIQVYLNFGGSGTMLSQMELSQSGDLYIPGSQDYLVKAERRSVIDAASVEKIAYLIPVIAVPKGNPKNIQSLADLARPGIEVGIGNPSAVCLGLYAVEIFDFNHLLEDINHNIVVHAESCEKTATLVSLKTVDAVIGWDVFRHWDPGNIDVVYLSPQQLPRIAYIPAAVTTFTENGDDARKFIDFLVSPEGQSFFRKWGYITSESDAGKLAPGAEIGGEYRLPDTYRPPGN
jgi:molybdate transport system substrate-binding protein